MGLATTFCARSAAVGPLGAGVVAQPVRTAIRQKLAKKLSGWARLWRDLTVMRTPSSRTQQERDHTESAQGQRTHARNTQVPLWIGRPCRDRTCDQRIKRISLPPVFKRR